MIGGYMSIKSQTYIHYGADHFDENVFREKIQHPNEFLSMYKPAGLWGSPVDSEYGWKDFVLSEDFNVASLEKHFTFRLKKSAKVLHFYRFVDAMPYLYYNGEFRSHCLDLAKIYRSYDAVELHITNDYARFKDVTLCMVFNMWDVDSICVWNKDILVL